MMVPRNTSLFALIAALLLLSGCSTKKFVAARHPDGATEVVVHTKGKGASTVKVKEQVYYANGQLAHVGHFKEGVEHGTWTYYYQDGTRKCVERWDNGKEHGVRYEYAPDGQLRREMHYDQGRLLKEVDHSRK